jgi:hypothetical protein
MLYLPGSTYAAAAILGFIAGKESAAVAAAAATPVEERRAPPCILLTGPAHRVLTLRWALHSGLLTNLWAASFLHLLRFLREIHLALSEWSFKKKRL